MLPVVYLSGFLMFRDAAFFRAVHTLDADCLMLPAYSVMMAAEPLIRYDTPAMFLPFITHDMMPLMPRYSRSLIVTPDICQHYLYASMIRHIDITLPPACLLIVRVCHISDVAMLPLLLPPDFRCFSPQRPCSSPACRRFESFATPTPRHAAVAYIATVDVHPLQTTRSTTPAVRRIAAVHAVATSLFDAAAY